MRFKHRFQLVEKVCFSKKCLSSIPIPFRTLWWLCFVQSSVCPYFGILAENPFPSGWRAVYAWLALHLCNRGRLLSVHPAPTLFDHLCASLRRAFGHTRPASVPGLSVGLPPSPSKDACSQSHTVAARCSDTNDWQPALGLRPKPHFKKIYSFLDRLSRQRCQSFLNG